MPRDDGGWGGLLRGRGTRGWNRGRVGGVGGGIVLVLKGILWVAAAALVLVTIATAAARLSWLFDLFTHFRLQYVVAAAVFGALAVCVGAWRPAVVLLVVALFHAWTIKDLWLGGEAAAAGPAGAGTPVRVASANVQVDSPSPQQVVAFARDAGPDLLMLVETQTSRWRPVLTDLAALYPHQAPAGWRDGASVILFSRYPIVAQEVVRPPEGRRPYLKAQVEIAGRRVTVLGVHPASPSPGAPQDSHIRNRALDHITRKVWEANRSAVVMGDFNTSPWSPHFRDLIAATDLRNAADGHGWIGTWPRWLWPAQIPIDHVLVAGPIAVTDVERGASTGSDHYPVVADLLVLPRE